MLPDLWYRNSVVYNVDLETFQDSNGDGVGDFEGLSRRLDYLESLGVNALWLGSFQPTPNRDNGYDISDYYGVDPRHGTLGDFVEFLHEARSRGIRVLMDLVVNHTSDRHPWFREARNSESSRFHDLVRLVEEAAGELEDRDGLPGRAGTDVDAGARGRQALLPPLLRVSAGPEHGEPGGARGDPPRDRVLARARRLRLPARRGAVHPREARAGRRDAPAPLRVPRGDAPLRAVACRRRRAPRRGERPPRRGEALSRRPRRAAPDVQLLGQPALVLRARLR